MFKQPNFQYNVNISSMSDQNTHSASQLKKKKLIDYEDSRNLKPSLALSDQKYFQKEQNDIDFKCSQIFLKQRQKNRHQVITQSARQIKSNSKSSYRKQKNLNYIQQQQSVDSGHTNKSSKSTTSQQIMSKYDVSQIVKRAHTQEQKQYYKLKIFVKVILMILFFPFSLIWLLTQYLSNKNRLRDSKNKQDNSQKGALSIKKPRRRQTSKCQKGLQKCCQDCFCYIVCCQCCENCNLCSKFCSKLQKCLQCLCQNSLVECIQNCFYSYFIKNCQKCCRCICCHKRTHDKLDTIQRLENMSRKSQQ